MSGFVIGFVGAVVGGVVASIAATWLEYRFRAPANTHPDDPIENVPGWLAVRIGAVSVACAWICLVALLLFSAWALVSERLLGEIVPEHLQRLIVFALGVFSGIGLLYMGVAVTARCPKCGRHVFVQWIRKPPFSEKVLGLDAWAAVVLTILLRGRFRCMYCGQRYSATPNNAVQRPGCARR